VYALAAGGATVYAGGTFNQIGGQPRNGLAELLVSNAAATDWDAKPSLGALALGLTAGTVYVGGFFSGICDRPQNGVAAISADRTLGVGNDPGAVGGRLTAKPNPMRGSVEIQYTVARTGRVRLDLLDVSGRVVRTILDEVRAPGRQLTSWSREGSRARIAPGLYFLRLKAPDRVTTTRLAIVD